MELRTWAPEHESEVSAFVAKHPDGLVYYGPSFRRYLLSIVGGECRSRLAFEDGRLTAIMPILLKSGPYGVVLNSLPFFGTPGGILTISPSAELALRAEYERLAADVSVAAWIGHPFVDVAPPAHTMTDERIAQWTDLDAGGAATLLDRIEPSARRNIQKAQAEGVVVSETPGAVDFLEATHRRNMAAIGGRSKPPEFFSSLAKTMTYGRDWRLYMAERRGERLAALLTFEAARTVEYVMPVVQESARGRQPTALRLLKAMTDAAARGFTRWNWGGTWLTQEGVYRFKKKWGARERRYHYYVTINDRTFLQRSAADLSAGYPWYYTVPYGSLEPAHSKEDHGQ